MEIPIEIIVTGIFFLVAHEKEIASTLIATIINGLHLLFLGSILLVQYYFAFARKYTHALCKDRRASG